MQPMGLYYPYIHFRDEQWPKLAALYWPRIARVVPNGYGVRDSRTAEVLADELDFVVSVAPDRSAAAVAGIFTEAIERDVPSLGGEFDAFRVAVAAAPAELARLALESADPAIVTVYLGQVVARRFEQQLTELRASMRGLGVETVLGAAGMKFELPAAVAALGGTLALRQPAVAAAGGLAYALVGLGRSWKQGRQSRLDASPASYLLRVEEGLRPRSLLARVQDPRQHDDRTT